MPRRNQEEYIHPSLEATMKNVHMKYETRKTKFASFASNRKSQKHRQEGDLDLHLYWATQGLHLINFLQEF